MRAAFIFLLVLFFQLLGGHKLVHASTANGKSFYATAQQNLPSLSFDLSYHRHDYLITRDDGFNAANAHLIGVEDEDENEEDLVRKHVSLAKSLVAFVYTFIAGEHLTSLPDPIAPRGHLSYIESHKYIAQRVFRI